MKKHWWVTVNQGWGLSCEKCDIYIDYDDSEYDETKESACEVTDREAIRQFISALQTSGFTEEEAKAHACLISSRSTPKGKLYDKD